MPLCNQWCGFQTVLFSQGYARRSHLSVSGLFHPLGFYILQGVPSPSSNSLWTFLLSWRFVLLICHRATAFPCWFAWSALKEAWCLYHTSSRFPINCLLDSYCLPTYSSSPRLTTAHTNSFSVYSSLTFSKWRSHLSPSQMILTSHSYVHYFHWLL